MREFVPERSVGKDPEDAHDHSQNHDRGAASNQRVHWSRTRARHGPTQPKEGATEVGTFVPGGFVCEFNDVSFEAFDLEGANQKDTQGANRHRAADDAVHVEALEGKHLLNAEPRQHLSFNQNQAEERPQNQSDDVFHGQLVQDEGKKDPRHDQSTREKAKHGHQRGKLKMAEAHDGMAGSATTRVSRAEANQEASENNHEQGWDFTQPIPRKQFRRVLTREILNSEIMHARHGGVTQRDGCI